MNRLIVISAPSGAGKSTLCARLLKELPQLVLSISSTTRAPRGQEQHGREYFFVTKETFEEDIRNGRFAEWAKVHDHYYGTSRQVIEDTFASGKSVLLDIDVQGAESLRRAFPVECYSVFIAPPDLATLEKRLRGRGTDKEDVILKRMRNAEKEMRDAPRFHVQVVNDDLNRAYTELKELVLRALAAPASPPGGSAS